ncbi:MAG: hypothetical protein AAF958_16650, partial [Planctomycetota bacterium]
MTPLEERYNKGTEAGSQRIRQFDIGGRIDRNSRRRLSLDRSAEIRDGFRQLQADYADPSFGQQPLPRRLNAMGQNYTRQDAARRMGVHSNGITDLGATAG